MASAFLGGATEFVAVRGVSCSKASTGCGGVQTTEAHMDRGE